MRVEVRRRPDQGIFVVDAVPAERDAEPPVGEHLGDSSAQAADDIVLLDRHHGRRLGSSGDDLADVKRLDRVHVDDPDGAAAVKWWREKCIEWCYDYVDGDRFADQGYLQELSTRFPRVRVIENVGANLAPWNIGNYRVEFRDGKVLIDSTYPLIFFHFQGFKREMSCFIFNSHRLYRAPFSKIVRDHIYKPYVDELLAIERTIGVVVDVAKAQPLQRKKVDTTWNSVVGAVRNVGMRLFRVLDIATGRAFIVIRGKAY